MRCWTAYHRFSVVLTPKNDVMKNKIDKLLPYWIAVVSFLGCKDFIFSNGDTSAWFSFVTMGVVVGYYIAIFLLSKRSNPLSVSLFWAPLFLGNLLGFLDMSARLVTMGSILASVIFILFSVIVWIIINHFLYRGYRLHMKELKTHVVQR